MGRRSKDVPIERAESRDHGRTYVITEMSPARAEKWALRALNGLATSGVDVMGVAPTLGMAGLAVVGIEAMARMPWALQEPLLDEMFTCVQFKQPNGDVRPLTEHDIEEVETRILLRGEVLSLHLGFSLAEKLSALRDSLMKPATQTSPTTETSPTSSEPSSAAAWQLSPSLIRC